MGSVHRTMSNSWWISLVIATIWTWYCILDHMWHSTHGNGLPSGDESVANTRGHCIENTINALNALKIHCWHTAWTLHGLYSLLNVRFHTVYSFFWKLCSIYNMLKIGWGSFCNNYGSGVIIAYSKTYLYYNFAIG